MTDKVQKIREEVERLKDEAHSKRYANQFQSGIESVCNQILSLIDSLQEEPVIVDAPPYDYVKGFSDGRLYEKRQKEEPVSEKKCMYSNDNYTDEERKVLCEDCEEECEYAKKKVLVSEELEDAAYQFVMDNFGNPKEPLYKFDQRCFKAGANWQRQKDEHLIWQTSTANYEKGIEEGKQQMMKDATGVTVHIDAGNYPYIPQLELYDYDNDVALAKEGDKYKVVLIKEE